MKVAGIGSAVPYTISTNSAVEERLGLESGWIEKRTGIRFRPVAATCQATSDLAIEASREALRSAGVSPSDIGLLLLATSTPDHLLPPTAPLVAHRLQLIQAGAVDIAGACSGFLYSLVMGNASGLAMRRPVLLVGANVLSRRVNDCDPATVALFADGAGALVLVPSRDPHVLGTFLGADGSRYDAIKILAGGTREAITPEALLQRRNLICIQDRRTAYKCAVRMMADAGGEALGDAGLSPADVDWWIPHQANARIIQECGSLLRIPEAKTVVVIDRCANSSAATVPIALAEAAGSSRVKRGDVVLLTAVGAGMTSAGVVLRW